MNNKLSYVMIGLAVLLLPFMATAQEESDGMLRIRSNGKTRIEIRNGNQVALYTGGVQFDYLDYRLNADQLRYSQQESYVEATGNVTLQQSGSVVESDLIQFHLDQNLLVSPGEIRGQLADQGLGFLAASATIQLSSTPAARDNTFIIALRDQVFVSSSRGYSFSTSHVSMDTGTRLINIPQQFSLRLPAGGSPAAGQPFSGDLLLTAASMTGTLDEDLQLESLHALATEVRGEQLMFSAGSVRAGFLENGHAGTTIDVLATGSPVRGVYRQPDEDLSFSADSISGTIDPGFGSQFLLSGGIQLSADLALLESDKLSIVQDSLGVRFVFPDGLEAGMALNVLSGNEDMDLSTILHK
jgi:lipopolysaccharide export system protein LptA